MNARKQISKIGWCYVAFGAVYLAVSIGLSAALSFFALALGIWDMGANLPLVLSQVVMYGVGFPVFYMLMKRLPSWKKPEGEPLGGWRLAKTVVICYGATYLGSLAGQGLMILAGLITGEGYANPVTDTVMGMDLGMLFLTTVVIAPVMEELMFRKLLIDRLIPLGQKPAVVISGVAFGLFHGNFYQFFYAAALGMVFAYLYSSTGRIRYNIGLHMFINMMGGVVPVLLSQGAGTGNFLASIGTLAVGCFAVGCVIAALAWFTMNLRKVSWFDGWIRPREGVLLSVVKAPGAWAFFLMTLFLFAVGG